MTKDKYTAAQKAFVAHFDLKKGDIVKVIRTAKDDEAGWQNVWDDSMDKHVGQEFAIGDIDATNAAGIHMKNDYWYPYFCLEFVRRGENLTIELDSGDYDAEVSANGKYVEVGCQEISFDTVKKIYDLMVKVQANQPAPKTPARKVAAKKVARRR